MVWLGACKCSVVLCETGPLLGATEPRYKISELTEIHVLNRKGSVVSLAIV